MTSEMLGSSSAPVPLSRIAEVERQGQIADAFAHVLGSACTSEPLRDALDLFMSQRDHMFADAEELERLWCVAHLSDLDACHSQHRLFCINYAVTHDDTLLEQEQLLINASESDRQAFFNGIYKRMKDSNFAGFAFDEHDFKAALEQERNIRAGNSASVIARIQELQASYVPAVERHVLDCGDLIANFPWDNIAATGSYRWRTNTDALTLEKSEDLWFVSQSWPTMETSSVDESEKHASCKDLLLVVDLSGSMSNMLHILKECIQDIIAHSVPGDRLCVVGFSSEPSLICDWTEIDSTDARKILRAAVEVMNAKGGTRLVPALQLVAERLRSRPFSSTRRSSAVVLISDGDPEEPADALCSAAGKAFSSQHYEAPLVIALALGEESRPDLMALLAQCGCGASLYIAGQDQLPAQLGRMWGILGAAFSPRDASASSQSSDAFLVLEPAEGAELIETERSPGGTLPLISKDGRQLIVLRCGRHAPPEEGGCYRFAARLRLPPWARSPIDGAALQRPLVRSTWIWSDADGKPKAASDILRAVQVPSLLIEAQVGFPFRVALAANSSDCENFDSERFLHALSDALGIKKDQLSLARLSPGSVIVDLQVLGLDAVDMKRLHGVCATSSQDVVEALVQRGFNTASGFDAAKLTVPGGHALRRVLQWRLAAALERAASGPLENAHDSLQAVIKLATSELAQRYDSDRDPCSGGVAAIASDAERVVNTIAAVSASGETSLTIPLAHAFEQQAHAHSQQVCPETTPEAVAVRCYEIEQVRNASLIFQTVAKIREEATLPGPPALLEKDASQPCTSVRLLCRDEDTVAKAVTAFRVVAHYGDRTMETVIPIQAGAANSPEGIDVNLPSIEPGAEHALVASASIGRAWGEQSQPILCRLHGTADPRGHGRTSVQNRHNNRSRRASSVSRNCKEVHLFEVSATALGTLSLSWDVPAKGQEALRWDVYVDAVDAESLTHFSAENLAVCHASFMGLVPSATYRFSISAKHLPQPSNNSCGQKPMIGSMDGLAVMGTKLGTSMSLSALPRCVEGMVVIPPFKKGSLTSFEADPTLQPLPLAGTFLRRAGSHSRNA